MRCGFCARASAEDARFCSNCGTPLVEAVACAGCASLNSPRQRFCGACGGALDAYGQPSPLAAHQRRLPDHIVTQLQAHEGRVAGEHKQVTVLFVDVKGSMDLSERIDAERWYTVMARFFGLLSDGVHRYGGRVDRFTGDGVMAVFGAPIAYEDHARRAAHSALHLHGELERYAAELAREYGLELSVRMGLNSGEVVVGSIGDDLSLEYAAIGRTAGLAQRMEALAQPGTIAMSESTAKSIAGYFELRELGAFEVKGARAPVPVFELTGAGPLQTPLELARTRGLSRFVGREAELHRLDRALAGARAGHGQAVAIVGEAGIGKSRLAWEFLEHLRAQGAEVWEVHGLAHAKALSFTPMLELLRSYFGIRESDDNERVRAKVRERVGSLSDAFEADLPSLLDFLGAPDPGHRAPRVDPEARRRRLFSVIGRLIAANSPRTPTVLLVEDLHWLDAGSEAFLGSLIGGLGDTSVLVVLTFRPDYVPPWGGLAHVQELRLSALEERASEVLLRELLGPDRSLDGVDELIAARALGNPFFCEELVAALGEAGALEGERGRYRLALTLEDIVLPATLQATVAARIDRLRAPEKQLLRVAAVAGGRAGRAPAACGGGAGRPGRAVRGGHARPARRRATGRASH